MSSDFRNLENGIRIPSLLYADQPEIVLAPDGALVCAVTTAYGAEGAANTFVGVSRSTDGGQTWSDLVKIDDSPYESSYSTLAVTDYGRIYCFYDLNDEGLGADDVFTEPNGSRAVGLRYDMGFGIFCFRYSDDSGKNWSSERYTVPVRVFDIDLENPLTCRGKHRYLFWNVSKPFFKDGKFYHAMIKFRYGDGNYIARSEGVLLVSDNLASERNPAKIRWETLPEGTKGITAPAGGGPIAEEQCFVPLSDGTLFCVFRTTDGAPGCTYSRDGGRSWEPSDYLRYPDGRKVKHVRAATFLWKYTENRYLYWFHNDGGTSWDGRNPAWVSAATEIDTPRGKRLSFSEPRILLYDRDPNLGISYPDMLLLGGKCYISETQKSITRMHEIPTAFLERLWEPDTCGERIFSATAEKLCSGEPIVLPQGVFDGKQIITLCMDADLTNLPAGTVLLKAVSDEPNGSKAEWRLESDENGALRVLCQKDAVSSAAPIQRERVLGGKHRLSVTFDASADVLHAASDGVFLDGGEEYRRGWSRFGGAFPVMDAAIMQINGTYIRSLDIYRDSLL